MGASVFNQTSNLKLTFPLGRYSTVFQAEIYAILACAYSLYNEHEASIAICSDIQAALKALLSAKTKSSLVAETKTALKNSPLLIAYVCFGYLDIATSRKRDW